MASGKSTAKTHPDAGFNLAGINLDSAGAGKNLSGRVAEVLLGKIREGGLTPGTRLPTEHVLAQRFGVSRTVIREAMISLKAQGVIETRQGSGAFVRQPTPSSSFALDPLARDSIRQILLMIELRRGIDSEIAALAASRRDPRQIEEIRLALRAVDDAVAAGGSGVREDLEFHLCLARATGNPYWSKLIEMFAPQIQAVITVTRAKINRRQAFQKSTKDNHERVVEAIVAGDVEEARAAARAHMDGAAERVAEADPEFWAREGKEQARLLGLIR